MTTTYSQYALGSPSSEKVQRHLAAMFGLEDGMALWNEAVRAAGLDAQPLSTLDTLSQVVAQLATQPDKVGLIGRGMQVRIRTYQLLELKRPNEYR